MDTYDYIQDREQLGKQLVSLVVTNHPGSRQTDKEEEMEKKIVCLNGLCQKTRSRRQKRMVFLVSK